MADRSASMVADTGMLLEPAAVDAFQASLRGELLRPGDAGYDQARTVWNAMIDKRPALIARCAGAADVISAVNFARAHNLLLAVRGGGHNAAGLGVCDDGLLIDLSRMRGIRVDVANQTVRAEAGITWSELDHETQAFGLATTGGTVSHTGVAGLTVGGGLGWLMAQHGLSCDNLLSADVVTADGQLLSVSPTQNQDLFWGIRGGGGNFGIVTSFEFKLHPVGPMVMGGMVLHPMAHARDVLRFYRDFSRDAPDAMTSFAGLISTPDGLPVVALIVGWFGPLDEAERYLEPVRSFGSPIADMVGTIPYRTLQSLLDGAAPFGIRRYWKSGYLQDLPDDFIDIMVDHAMTATSPLTGILLFHMHGAASRVSPDETAFGLRQDQWDLDILPQWIDAAEDERHITWARDFWKAVEPFTLGVYLGHLDSDDMANRVRAAYGPNYERLVALKTRYDPTNFFRVNQNIKPRA